MSTNGGPSISIDLLTATYNSTGNMEYPTAFSLKLPGVLAGDDLTVTVDMVDGVDALNNPQSLIVDNFSLTLIPEPTSIALAGLGLLVVLAIRRRR